MRYLVYYRKDRQTKIESIVVEHETLPPFLEHLADKDYALGSIFPHSDDLEIGSLCDSIAHSSKEIPITLHTCPGQVCASVPDGDHIDSDYILELLYRGWQHEAVNPFTGPERKD